MVNTYRQWVDGAEEFPEEDQKLKDNYGESFFLRFVEETRDSS